MVFDSLAHITKDGKWLDTRHDARLERLLNVMRQSQTAKCLLVGLPEKENNDFVSHAAQSYPEQFVPVYGINLQGKSESQLEDEIISLRGRGFRGIKIHPRLTGMRMDDPAIHKAIRLAHNNRLFTMFCTIQRYPNLPIRRPVYDVIHEICSLNADAAIIFMHGGYYELLAASEILRGYENTLLDLSCTFLRFHETSIAMDIKFLLKTFDQRICVGSDFPEYEITQVIKMLEEKYFPGMDQDKIQNIKFGNLEKMIHYYE